MLLRFLRERQPLVDTRQGGLQVSRPCIQLREETFVEWRSVLVTLIQVILQRLPILDRADFRVDEPASRPTGKQFTDGEI